MEHKVNLSEISDGKLYSLSDSVCIDCDGCGKQAECCRFAEDTITLDPYDFFLLASGGLGSFTELYQKGLIGLLTDRGLILPHLAFNKERCPFLEGNGRCRIHAYRPGLCRLFPLARIFEENHVSYILQIHECPLKAEKSVTVSDWLGYKNASEYEAYSLSYSRLLTRCRAYFETLSSPQDRSSFAMAFLRYFFQTPYEDFFPEFSKRTHSFCEAFTL